VSALYAARPDLVTLTPKLSEINALVRAGLRECPGMEITEETTTQFRS
jgi:hypothetical protein